MAASESNVPLLIRRMLSPDFYPHATSDPIRLIPTHISYILLTGGFAYKVKKPVNTGFLDFTTLQSRQFFCEEEVRLNRRAAPEVYIGVETICQEGETFGLGGMGVPLEYAVKMRQLPQEGLFNALLAEGRLTPELIEKLARTVAAFHQGISADHVIDPLRAIGRVRRNIEENYRLTQRFIGTLQTQEHFEQTKAFTDRFFFEYQNLFKRRAIDGHVRDCHGDLHLGNICLWDEKVLLFDCIEFDESLRVVDVVQDAAFAAMDLQAFGRDDLATLFINTYFERTGDWEGIQLLRLYLCRHAYVRAMVNSMSLDEPGLSVEVAEEDRKWAADYYRLAWEYSTPWQGRIILVTGLSGSGKSTLARRLAQQIGAIHIRSDAVRKHLAGVPLDQKGDESLYSREMSERTYNRLLDLGLLLARAGYPVLLDAKYDRASARREAVARCEAAGLQVRMIQCVAPPGVIRERLATRRRDISDAGVELLDRQQREAEGFEDSERGRLTVVDTSQPVDCPALARALG